MDTEDWFLTTRVMIHTVKESLKVIFWMGTSKESQDTFGVMGIGQKEIAKMVLQMAKEFITGKMEIGMKDNSKLISLMERVQSILKMGQFNLVCGRKESILANEIDKNVK